MFFFKKKIALCFMISYEHRLVKEELWKRWIYENKDIINVYFHYKDFRKIKSNWIKSRCIPKQFIKQTSYYFIVDALDSIMHYAYLNKHNYWFVLLTESCVPIVDPKIFRNKFYEYYDRSIINCSKCYWNVDLHKRANLRFLPNFLQLSNNAWFILNRNHFQYCLMFKKKNYKLYNLINNGGLANESIYAVILRFYNIYHPGNKNTKLINSCSTLSNWNFMSSPTSPYIFKNGSLFETNLIDEMINNEKVCFFLRKVNQEFPNEILYKYCNIQKKKHSNFYKNTFLFLIFSIPTFFSSVLYLLYINFEYNIYNNPIIKNIDV